MNSQRAGMNGTNYSLISNPNILGCSRVGVHFGPLYIFLFTT